MKIIMNDNWLGKLLDYPTNICVFAWGVLWRLACAVIAVLGTMGFVWLWGLAFYDGFISGHPKAGTAFVVWLIMTVIVGVVITATKEYWYDNSYVKRLRASVVSMCPTLEWNRGEAE
jgi:hypothetical protein